MVVRFVNDHFLYSYQTQVAFIELLYDKLLYEHDKHLECIMEIV